jgi:hypothetical protein
VTGYGFRDRFGLFLVLAIQPDRILDLVSIDNLKMKSGHLHTSSRGNACRFSAFRAASRNAPQRQKAFNAGRC